MVLPPVLPRGMVIATEVPDAFRRQTGNAPPLTARCGGADGPSNREDWHARGHPACLRQCVADRATPTIFSRRQQKPRRGSTRRAVLPRPSPPRPRRLAAAAQHRTTGGRVRHRPSYATTPPIVSIYRVKPFTQFEDLRRLRRLKILRNAASIGGSLIALTILSD